ncbi:hypothetical protein ACFWZ7_05155 [Nocardiopsis alba]|uniref:Uncharacterized protein n=1 Tax=Nocardiopsis alba TaxID=53437 RepID=A0A7K2IT17_9ACTN|nr:MULTISPECIES: hypothetical protein [Nocardiopsis]MEC3893449.1 hypothetical protein [Nocardiopsis sp. LDBS1602]MYR33053.1 hypothetical protein [Nocardiopsis alba]
MTPVQIVRAAAVTLIAGGSVLGLVPGGPCGAGWWSPDGAHGAASFGWFAYTEISTPPREFGISGCATATAPVASWAIALLVMGAVLLVLSFNAHRLERSK